jgi:hypothetical protein
VKNSSEKYYYDANDDENDNFKNNDNTLDVKNNDIYDADADDDDDDNDNDNDDNDNKYNIDYR